MAISKDNAEIQKARAHILIADRKALGKKWKTVRESFRGCEGKACYSAAWDFVIEDYQPVYEDKHGSLALHEAHFLAEWMGKKLQKT